MFLEYKVLDDKYQNINQVLKQEFKISNRLFNKLILNKHVLLNDGIINTRNNLKLNDIIKVDLNFDEDPDNIVPTKMNLEIIYEDDGLLILNKPAGIAIHPSILHYHDSLSNGVKYYFESIGLKRKIRPVNRLDLNTSGLVVFAKNEYIQECLIKQMQSNEFQKEYIAICEGIFESKKGIINLPIARKENSIIERCISDSGQEAITEYEVIQELQEKNISFVKCILKTGRTHQIRVHMSAISHPLIGDSLYGTTSDLINRQALHSCKISFIHPISNVKLNFTCNLPNDFKTFNFC